MTKQLHVAVSPLTATIYCGHILKSGQEWAVNKTDVTGEASFAVAERTMILGGVTEVRMNDVPIYEITVRKLPLTEEDPVLVHPV